MKLWSQDGTGREGKQQDDGQRRWKDRREDWNIYVDTLILFYKERSILATPWQISYFWGRSLGVP